MPPRILVLSASVGAGHMRAAEAVELALRHLAGQPMTREQALKMRGAHAMGEVPADSGPHGSA